MTSSFQWSLPPEPPFPRNAAARTTSTVLLLAVRRAPGDGLLDPAIHRQRPPPGPEVHRLSSGRRRARYWAEAVTRRGAGRHVLIGEAVVASTAARRGRG